MNLLNIFVALLGLISTVVSGYSLSNKSKGEKGRNIFLIIVGLVVMVGTLINGVLQDKIDAKETLDKNRMKREVSATYAQLQAKINNDKQFEDWLKERFKIVRDTLTNQPKTINFDTKIEKARDVYIGPNN